MKKGQVFEGVIEKVAFPNKGHITVDGNTLPDFLWNYDSPVPSHNQLQDSQCARTEGTVFCE